MIRLREDHPVREVLLERGLWQLRTLSPDTSVLEAAALLEEEDVGAVVVTKRQAVVGVLSERDCTRRVLLEGKDPGETPVASVMNRQVCSVTALKKVSECIDLMLRRHIRHLPVYFGTYLVGCVSLRDLTAYLYGIIPHRGSEEAGRPPSLAGKRRQ